MKESQITTKILHALNQGREALYWKIVAHPFQQAGLPDIIGVDRGRFQAIEVKVNRSKKACPIRGLLTTLQYDTLAKIWNLGGNSQVALYLEGRLGFYLIPLKHVKNYELITDFKTQNKDYFTVFR